jgi:hypothetical protein
LDNIPNRQSLQAFPTTQLTVPLKLQPSILCILALLINFLARASVRGAPDSDFYYLAGYRICWISEKNPAGYRIFYQFEYLTYNIYYKDFSHPCISAEGDNILIFE